MAGTVARRQTTKERKRTVDSRRDQKATEAVLLACSAVTHHLGYQKTIKKTRPIIGLSLKQVGVIEPKVFKEVLKEILDPIAPEIEKLEIDPSQTLSSVIGM